MNDKHAPLIAMFNRCRFKGWLVFGIALLSFAAGSLLSVQFMRPTHVRAENNHVFELMVYHTRPGKVAELESIFRDVSKLQVKHHLNAVGYWVPADGSDNNPAWKDTFVYLVAHVSVDEAKKNWNALHTIQPFCRIGKLRLH